MKISVANKKPESSISYSATSKSLRITHQQLDRHVQAGCPREPDGTFYLSKVRAWLAKREQQKVSLADLKWEKLQADILDKKEATRERRQRMRIEAGLLHDGKQCDASLGEVITALWMEIQTLPNRGQSAFPEVPNLEIVLRDIVNAAAIKLQAFAKLKGIAINRAPVPL